jgi:hypothetical protein
MIIESATPNKNAFGNDYCGWARAHVMINEVRDLIYGPEYDVGL